MDVKKYSAIKEPMMVDKRSSERHTTMGLMSTVSDGKGAFLGVVQDISETGLCMAQVPHVFDDTVEHCITIVKGPVRDFKVVMRPCWSRTTNRGMYKVIGFHIDEPTESWKGFVNQITRETHPFNALVVNSEVEM